MAIKDINLGFEPECPECPEIFEFIKANESRKTMPNVWEINNRGISPNILIDKSTGFYDESGHIGFHYRLASEEITVSKEQRSSSTEKGFRATFACSLYK